MSFLVSITIGLSLVLIASFRPATAYSALLTQTPSKAPAQKQRAANERDVYCPPKEERETFCSDKDTKRCTPLMRAAEAGRIEEVRALLASKVNVNARGGSGHSALMFAANEGHLEIVKALLKAGADPNATGGTFHYGAFVAWMSALNPCNENWLEIFDAMLEAGVELNPKLSIHFSPLGYLVSRLDNPAMIGVLVKRGANVNSRDVAGETALMLAARYSSADVVKALIIAGADVNARNNEGKTVLMIAEESNGNLWRKEIVQMLKESGAQR